MSDEKQIYFMIRKGKEPGRRMSWFKNCIGENFIFRSFDNAFNVFKSLRKQYPAVQLIKFTELNGECSRHVIAQTWEDES